MKKYTLILLIVSSLFIPNKSFSWSKEGHHYIAEIAYQLLSSQAKLKLTAYLNGISIDESGTWLDEVKRDPQYRYLEHTHYINLDKGNSLDLNSTDNIYWELTKTMSELDRPNSLSKDQIKLDLLILIHLTGDLHQPLHDGYGSDRGGNEVQISLMGKHMNLHSAWDQGIIHYKQISEEDLLHLYSGYSANQIRLIKQGNIVSWLNESRGYLGQVYSFKGHELDERYVDQAQLIIEQQLLKASIRLSFLLQKYLDKLPTTTASNTIVSVTNGRTVTAEQAAEHIGENVTVSDLVYSYKATRGGMIFLNLGGDYPGNPLTIVIKKQQLGNFSVRPDEFYNGKKVIVSGVVKLYRGKPEIELVSQDQIKVIK